VLLLSVAGLARSRPTVRSHYPDLDLGADAQKAWSQSWEYVNEQRLRGRAQVDSLLSATLLRLLPFAEGGADPRPELRIQLASGDAPWLVSLPNGDMLLHAAAICLMRDMRELEAVLAHLMQHPLDGHFPCHQMLMDRRIARPARDNPLRKALRLVSGNASRPELSITLAPMYEAALEDRADSLGRDLLQRAGADATAMNRLRARLDGIDLPLECVNAHLEVGREEAPGPSADGSAALLELQRRLIPGVVQDLCRHVDRDLAVKRPRQALLSPLLDTLVARGRECGLGEGQCGLLEARRDLTLHGTKDGSLERFERQMATNAQLNPGEYELILLRAEALVLLKRESDALDLYRQVEADPDYSGRRGVLRLTITRLESKLKDKPNDKN
jgi:hypothetical protein